MAEQDRSDELKDFLSSEQEASSEDDFFRDLFTTFEQWRRSPHLLETSGCPSEETLRAYMAGELPDRLTFEHEEYFLHYLAGESPEWAKSEVSLHALICESCSESIQTLRERAQRQPKKKFWERPERIVAFDISWKTTLMHVGVVVLIMLLNWWPVAIGYDVPHGIGNGAVKTKL